MGERLIIRSYRRVFEVDRRIYRVDRWALPVPGGIPLRGVGYFVTTVLGIVVLGALPGSGQLLELLELLSPPLRYVVLPLLVAVLGTQVAPDGRAAHRFAADWLRLQVRARRRCADRVVALEGEAVPWHGELALRWDGHGTELRRGRVRGPARVTFNVPVQLRDCDGRLQARPHAAAEAGQAVVLCGGAVLEVSR